MKLNYYLTLNFYILITAVVCDENFKWVSVLCFISVLVLAIIRIKTNKTKDENYKIKGEER